MLDTPAGRIEVYIDAEQITYEAYELSGGGDCEDLSGRYCIRVHYVPDGKQHEISCCISGHGVSDRDEIESGECRELKSIYKGDCKLSIGMEGDAGYFEDESRVGDYDYDNEYTDNGVKYVILPDTKTEDYIFGIA